ncbi:MULTISPECIES: HDOD domain-containing protein [Gammaproteobacteria]|uniref:HDOD domain-containing protein n=1 Tax=Gammaproteobacteria TaxID=1236 RepID=UPI000DD032B1|nr:MULTISPECIES: HDOD domain-containing protein [Gammaproteobacteria]RTE85548.1 HDOD domain-containing protein [Aliidiomarina sp. B3213]TCZ89518.1 HDOD domain-containing protein [Lysobacter sp. N42]
MATKKAFLSILENEISQDTLKLPTLPDIAIQVEQAANDPDVSLQDLNAIIARDPALSARMVKLANSAWLGRAVRVESLQQALTRIGLWQVRNIVVGLAMEQLFEAKNDIVRRRMQECWLESVKLTAAVVVLLKNYDGKVRLHQHTAALMTMTSQIGALPVLTMAEKHADTFANPTFINDCIASVAPSLSGMILKAWKFADEQIHVGEHWQGAIVSFKPSYLSIIQLAGVLTETHSSQRSEALLSCFVQTGLLPAPNWWEQEHVQAEYKSILEALS